MKKYLLLLMAVCCFQVSKAQSRNEKDAVRETISKFFDGFSNMDINTIKRYSTPDFLLLEDAMVWNIDTIAQHFESTKARKITFTRINSFDFIRTETRGNTAWVVYHNRASISRGEKKIVVEWLESAVLLKHGKEWKIQMMHSTPEKKKE